MRVTDEEQEQNSPRAEISSFKAHSGKETPEHGTATALHGQCSVQPLHPVASACTQQQREATGKTIVGCSQVV